MKKIFTLLSIFCLSLTAFTQSFGETAPDFTVTDIDGNEISLYADILDQGLIAIVDVSATWCGPCWSLHESHVLSDIQDTYGPNGTNQVRVIYYEGDAATTLEDVQGTGGSTIGDWTDGATYPIVNESPLQLDLALWAPLGFPTVNVIDPSDKTFVADPWNVFDISDFVGVINDSVEDADLDVDLALSTEELDVEVDFNVFPNPTADVTTISLSGFSGEVTLKVLDLLGQEVLSLTTLNKVEKLDLSEIPTGNYIIQALADTAEITKRISVVH